MNIEINDAVAEGIVFAIDIAIDNLSKEKEGSEDMPAMNRLASSQIQFLRSVRPLFAQPEEVPELEVVEQPEITSVTYDDGQLSPLFDFTKDDALGRLLKHTDFDKARLDQLIEECVRWENIRDPGWLRRTWQSRFDEYRDGPVKLSPREQTQIRMMYKDFFRIQDLCIYFCVSGNHVKNILKKAELWTGAGSNRTIVPYDRWQQYGMNYKNARKYRSDHFRDEPIQPHRRESLG